MNLARAFGELELGAELYCLHKNRWWQTSRGPLLDSGAFVAGLEYAAGVEATVLGKPSPAYFEAALEALDAEPELTWMVGDDLDSDVAGAQRYGLKTVLVRTGKFRPDAARALDRRPDAVISSIAYLPEWLERAPVTVGVDLIEIERIRRALERYPSFRERCFTEAEQAYCDSRPEPGAALRRALRRQGGGREGDRLRRGARVRVARRRDRRPAEARRPAVGAHGGVGANGSARAASTSR